MLVLIVVLVLVAVFALVFVLVLVVVILLLLALLVEKNNTNFMESILTYSYKKMVRYKIYFFLKKKVVKILGKIVKVFSVTELTLWPNSQAKIFQKAIYKVSRFPIYM